MTRAAGRLHGRRLRRRAGGRVGRVEVGRLGGELGGAGVDHRVAGPQPERQAGIAQAPPGPPRPGRPARGRRSRPAWPSRGGSGPASSRGVGQVARRRRDRPLEARPPGRTRRGTTALIPVATWIVVLRDAPAEQRQDPPQAGVGRSEEAAQDDRGGGPLGVAGRLAGLAVRADPADRGGLVVGLGVGRRGPPRGRPGSAPRPDPRPAARPPPARGPGAPCSGPTRRSGRWPSPRRSPSSGCPASGPRSGTCRTGSGAA